VRIAREGGDDHVGEDPAGPWLYGAGTGHSPLGGTTAGVEALSALTPPYGPA
jgi:hypothetical protein